jgi:hypothetical protein
MVLEHELLESIPLHIQGLNNGKCIYELEDHVGEKALSSNLWLSKLEPIKKIPCVGFLNHLLENAWVKFAFPYAMLPFHKGVEQNTIGITKGTNVKQPHHRGLVLAYLVENKMPLVHHSKE